MCYLFPFCRSQNDWAVWLASSFFAHFKDFTPLHYWQRRGRSYFLACMNGVWRWMCCEENRQFYYCLLGWLLAIISFTITRERGQWSLFLLLPVRVVHTYAATIKINRDEPVTPQSRLCEAYHSGLRGSSVRIGENSGKRSFSIFVCLFAFTSTAWEREKIYILSRYSQ